MKILKPFYYDEFTCVADKCKDTCCAGWGIMVDNKSYEKYQNVKGEFGKKLKDLIKVGESNKFILDSKGCCPFLQENLLCEIYTNLGEDAMCDVCKTYPRLQKKYMDVTEQTLSLSCPEVARILVKYNQPIEFCFGETKEREEITNIKKIDLFNGLIGARGFSVDLMQIDEIPIWKKIYICLVIMDKIQKLIDIGEISDIRKVAGQFQNEDYLVAYINALDEIKDNIPHKINYYKSLFDIVKGLKITNQKYLDFALETVSFFNTSEVEDNFDKIYHDFELAIRNDRVYENYIVYYLFHYYMAAYENENIIKYAVLMVESYALIKLFAMVRWYNNGFQISQEEMIDILYSYSRVIEHGDKKMDTMYEEIKKKELDKLAYLAILLR